MILFPDPAHSQREGQVQNLVIKTQRKAGYLFGFQRHGSVGIS
jgi:hypothetical protein